MLAAAKTTGGAAVSGGAAAASAPPTTLRVKMTAPIAKPNAKEPSRRRVAAIVKPLPLVLDVNSKPFIAAA